MTTRLSQTSETALVVSEVSFHQRLLQTTQRVLLGDAVVGGPFVNQVVPTTLIQIEAPPLPVNPSGVYHHALVEDPSYTRSIGTSQQSLVSIERPEITTGLTSANQVSLVLQNAPVPPLSAFSYAVASSILISVESAGASTRSVETAQNALLQTEHPSFNFKSNALSVAHKTLIIDAIRPTCLIPSVTNLTLVLTEAATQNPERMRSIGWITAEQAVPSDPTEIIPEYSTAQVIASSASSVTLTLPQSLSLDASASVLSASNVIFVSDVIQSDSLLANTGILTVAQSTHNDPALIQSDAMTASIGLYVSEQVELVDPDGINSMSNVQNVAVLSSTSRNLADPSTVQSVNKVPSIAQLYSSLKVYPESVQSMSAIRSNAFLSSRSQVWREPSTVHSDAFIGSVQTGSAAYWLNLRDPAFIRPDSRVMNLCSMTGVEALYGWPVSDAYISNTSHIMATDVTSTDPEEIDGDVRQVYALSLSVAQRTTMYEDPTLQTPSSRRNYNIMHGIVGL